jgi:hydroxymethylbilane synthase
VRTLVLGTRGSALAQAQAREVQARLAERHPGVSVTLRVIRTTGDRQTSVPVHAVSAKGVFVKELEEELLAGRIDFAVHSAKDLPGDLAPGLTLAAFPPREDARDALVTATGAALSLLPAGARVGTGSIRRVAQLRAARPDLAFLDLRGNVDTRLGRIDSGRLDAVILAMAGLNRLGLAGGRARALEPEICLPAPAQGAIAVEARTADTDLLALLASIDDPPTHAEATAERAVLTGLDAGCLVPLAALARAEQGRLALRALVASPDGRVVIRVAVSGRAAAATAVGEETARRLLEEGAGPVLDSARRPPPAGGGMQRGENDGAA